MVSLCPTEVEPHLRNQVQFSDCISKIPNKLETIQKKTVTVTKTLHNLRGAWGRLKKLARLYQKKQDRLKALVWKTDWTCSK